MPGQSEPALSLRLEGAAPGNAPSRRPAAARHAPCHPRDRRAHAGRFPPPTGRKDKKGSGSLTLQSRRSQDTARKIPEAQTMPPERLPAKAPL